MGTGRGNSISVSERRDVISISWGASCGPEWLCKLNIFDDPLYSTAVDYLQSSVLLATTDRTVVVASAGNDGISLDGGPRIFPAELEQVIAVGSINQDTSNRYNFGSSRYLGPYRYSYHTIPDHGRHNWNRRVASLWWHVHTAPFVAGIIGLMKALDPSLRWDDVQTILQNTANPSSDPKVTKGYVDAFRQSRGEAESAAGRFDYQTLRRRSLYRGAAVSHWELR